MMDMMLMMLGYLPLVLSILGALSVLVAIIAKATPNTTDDQVASFLQLLHDFLAKFAPGQASLATKRAGQAVMQAGATVVVDHRKL